jgi:hypothetical protein
MKHATVLVLSLMLVCLSAAPALAHPFTVKGTVVAATPTKISVSITDATTKKTVVKVFEIDKETKILRGDVVVTFAAAQIQKGEAISVTGNLDNGDDLADVIRLPVRK